MTTTVTTLMLVALTVLGTSIAQLLQKQAATQLTDNRWPSLLLNTPFQISVLLLGISLFSWLLVLKRLDVSVAYPLLSINFILVPILAHWKFDECMPFHRRCGSAIIIVGLTILFIG